MHTLKLLKESGLDGLYRLGIRPVKRDGLILLNYSQVESPKFHPVVNECRSLLLTEDLQLVSRSFDRFYNHSQVDSSEDISDCDVFEKMDGSLLNMYYHNGWKYRLSGSLDLNHGVWDPTGLDSTTWIDYVNKCMADAPLHLANDRDCTYIFEIVGKSNKIVVQYPEADYRLLAVRHRDGRYMPIPEGFKRPRSYKFSTLTECVQAANSLPNLEEGFVIYKDGPILKVKSDVYIKSHHMRFNDISARRVMDMVVEGDYDEYLSVFAEHKPMFEPFIQAVERMRLDMIRLKAESEGYTPQELSRMYSGVELSMIWWVRSDRSIYENLKSSKPNARIRLFKHYME